MFEKDVRPILKAHCTHCHGEEEKPEGGVDLRLRRFMDELIEPGQPAHSKLVEVIRNGEMPKKGKPLNEAEIGIVERWIAQGAKVAKAEPKTLAPGALITEEERGFWLFQPVRRPAVPKPADPSRARNALDAFIQEELSKAGLKMAPEADRRALLRRASLDLTGLLPTPQEVEEFVNDPDPRAYERRVERLLGSEAYAERWARHWLDVAGYADSNGFTEADSLRPHAWRYRDYVIESIAADKPWNQFIVEQLAGDEVAGATHGDYQAAVLDPLRRSQLVATGFLRLAPDGTGDTVDDAKLARNQVVAEQLKVLGSSLLGVTLACAQCHDHRYDPITQQDYYRLRAIFDPAYDWENWRAPGSRLYSTYSPQERQRAADIEQRAKAIETEARAMSKKFLDEIFEVEILKLPEAERPAFRVARATPADKQTPAQKALIKKYPSALATYSLDLYDAKKQEQVNKKMAEATALRATKPVEGFIMALTEVKGRLPASHLFNRGDHEQPKHPVQPGEMSVLAHLGAEALKPQATAAGSSGRRLAYARWLTNGKHPLVARTLVNRFWMHHMGRGLVNTPGDLGFQGERPTHPQLLDYLADEFVRGGWQLKPLHRLIMLSAAYRQSAVHPASLRADPDNRLYGRHSLRRLDAESLRDVILQVSGLLVRRQWGPPSGIGRDPQGRVIAGIDRGTITLNKVDPAGADDFRRSIYMQVRRSKPLTVLDTFDAPVMQPNCEKRAQTTVAPQALLLMNDQFVLDQSRQLAKRLIREAGVEPQAQARLIWQWLLGRPARADELQGATEHLRDQERALSEYYRSHAPPKGVVVNPREEALASLAQVLCSSNAFLYIE